MKHAKALGIKFVFTSVVLLSFFTLFANATTLEVLFVSVLVTAVSYLLGDLFILPKLGHLPAALSDFVLSFFAIWLLSMFLVTDSDGILLTSFATAMVLTFSEALFHSHMSNKVVNVKGSKSPEQRDKDERRIRKSKKVTDIRERRKEEKR